MTENGEASMSLQAEVDAIHWYHEFNFPDGVVAKPKTPDAASHRRLWDFITRELDRIDFAGKSVLDIGCWDGYWSFYSERRGASHVLATDDSSQNWAGDSGLTLAKRLLGSKIETDTDRSVYDLAKLDRTFDVILCLGVYYHLLDPFHAFAQIRHCCRPETVIVFEGDAFFPIPGGQMQPAAYYSADVTKAPRFVPEPEALRQMLRAAYFQIDHEAKFLLTEKPTGAHRILVRCGPMAVKNDFHIYRPPFGLHQYDTRWS